MKRLIFVGGGTFLRQLLDWVESVGSPADTRVAGYLGTGKRDEGRNIDLPMLGDAEVYQPHPDDRFLCALLDPADKLRFCRLIKSRGGEFATFMQPYSGPPRRTTLGEGCILAPKTELTADVVLEDFVTVLSFSGLGHNVTVGAGSTIGSHCDITGYVRIGEAVLLQPQVVVLPGVRLGDGSRVGAGSAVVADVPPATAVWGVPAKKVDTLLEAYC